jgi:hypothetical protein
MSKSVGETFVLMPTAEQRDWLKEIARQCTFAENAIWMEWRVNDPVQPAEVFDWPRIKEATGKWPKMPAYKLDGMWDLAKSLCPAVNGNVFGAIANHVRKHYPQKRWQYLRYDDRIPIARDLRIRFRERAIRVRRCPNEPRWFEIGLRLTDGDTQWMGIKPKGASHFTWEWLAHLADQDGKPSGGTISLVRKKRKWVWQLSLARERGEGEREAVDAIPDRWLEVTAPIESESFLRCEVKWPEKTGRPWATHIESNDIIRMKLRHDHLRKVMGANYHQSPRSNSRGHGRQRAIACKMPFSERYENRIKNWIENRSMAVVQCAIEAQCGIVRMENLTERDPQTLALGEFPYFRFMARVEQKCEEAGITFKKLGGLDKAKKALGVA